MVDWWPCQTFTYSVRKLSNNAHLFADIAMHISKGNKKKRWTQIGNDRLFYFCLQSNVPLNENKTCHHCNLFLHQKKNGKNILIPVKFVIAIIRLFCSDSNQYLATYDLMNVS